MNVSRVSALATEPTRKPPRIMAIANNKGGVGKSTTTTNLAHAFVRLGRRVLVLDNDGQHNTTSTLLGQQIVTPAKGMAQLYLDEANRPVTDFIVPTTIEGVDLIPADATLKEIDVPLIQSPRGRRPELLYRILRHKLHHPGLSHYDIVLIDCAPEWALKTKNAVVAATEILIPVMYGSYEMTGIGHLLEDINRFAAEMMLSVRIAGIVPIRVDHRTNGTIQWVETLKATWPRYVTPQIRYNSKATAAQQRWGTIFQTFPNSKCAEDYMGLAHYLLGR